MVPMIATLLLPLCLFLVPQHPVQGTEDPYVPPVVESSDEGAAALKKIQLPKGFVARLWASEPDLANPVSLYVDHRGRIFVAQTFRTNNGVTDMREHMGWLNDELAAQTVADRVAMYKRNEGDKFAEYSVAHEQVQRLADLDGDGVCDSSIVFADGFNDPAAGVGAGILVRGTDVWYACIPNLWKLTDEDDDGRAESREVLHTGYGVKVALLGHDLHGLRIGPDGRLYFSMGDRGLHIETQGKVFHLPDRGSVLRCELDGSGLEVFATGLRNPQELVFDDYGNLFTGDNNSDGGDKARWVFVVQGGDTGWRHHYQYLTLPNLRGPWNAEGQWKPFHEKQPWFLVPPIENVADGPSGLCMVPDIGWGDSMQGAFLLCDFRGAASHSSIMEVRHQTKGAGFELVYSRPLFKDLLPTDCDVGPDGALYVTDWVNGWGMTHKGRIFRLAPEGLDTDPRVLEQKVLLAEGMEGRSWEELGRLLGHEGRAVRHEAQLELGFRAARGSPGSEALRRGMGALLNAAYHGQQRPFSRLHGIWGVGMVARLQGAASGFAASIMPLAEDIDPQVRLQTIRVLGEMGDALGLDVLRRALAANDSAEQASAAHALANLRLSLDAQQRSSCIAPIKELLLQGGDRDPWLRHACIRALEHLGTAEEQRALLQSDSVILRRAGVVVLRRTEDAAIARALGDPDEAVVGEAARAIHEVPLPMCAPDLAALLEGPVDRDLYLLRRALAASRELHRPEDARRIAAWVQRDGLDGWLVREGLEALAGWAEPNPIDRVIGSWRPIEGDDSDLGLVLAPLLPGARKSGVAAVQAWIRLEQSQAVPEELALRDLLHTGEEESFRVAALEALLRRGLIDAPQLSTLLVDDSSKVASIALRELGRTDPGRAIGPLMGLARQGEAENRQAAVQALAQFKDRAGHGALARLLRAEASSPGPSPIALELLVALAGDPGEESATAMQAWRARAAADPVDPRGAIVRGGGNAERGLDLFRSKAEVSCLRCHRVGEWGTSLVGPDLTGVGSRLTQDEILWSILDPNRDLAEEYQAWTFLHQDGSMVVGRIVEETATELLILDAEGVEHTWEPDLVEGRRKGLSSMPEDMWEKLSDSELRDLLAFLQGQIATDK